MSSDKHTNAKTDEANKGAKSSGFAKMDNVAVKSHDDHEKAEHAHDKDKAAPAKPMEKMDKGVKTGV